MQPVRVVVADDEPIVRQALVDLIGSEPHLELSGAAEDAQEAIDLALAHHPDVVLLDVRMPAGGGLRAARTISRDAPGTRIVAMSAYGDRATVVEMLRAGATGYLVKGSASEDIVDGILRCARGERSLSGPALAGVMDELSGHLERELIESNDRHERMARILSVLDHGGPTMMFQPIVELSSQRVRGVEALARFNAPPPRGPHLWFAEAADVGLLVDLELTAIRAAFRCLDDLPKDVYLAVNLSPATVSSPGFGREIGWAPADRVVVEITEHAPVDDYDGLSNAMKTLRERGVRLAIDDAGAGFSSLRHILRLAPDIIKLDMTLTRDVDGDPVRQALVRAMIAFARETGASIVAEGIETAAEHETLAELGVSHGQGFLLAKPMLLPVPERITLQAGAA